MDVAPERTYETVLHGQLVTVSVYPPSEPKHVSWVLPCQFRGMSIDETVFCDTPAPKTPRR